MQGVAANNSTWELLDGRQLTDDEADDLLGRAYAATYHWRRAEGATVVNAAAGHGSSRAATPCSARASWRCTTPAGQCSRSGGWRPRRDFDHAYAHEATARALAGLGRPTRHEPSWRSPASSRSPIPRTEDLESDLKSEPWFGL